MTKLETAQRSLEDATVRRAEAARALQEVSDELSIDEIEALNTSFDETDTEVTSRTAEVAHQERLAAAVAAAPAPEAPEARLSVTEKPVYQKNDNRTSYFSDLYKAQRYQDRGALDRLDRCAAHARATLEERGIEYRESGTTETAGFMPPIWMADEWAAAARPGRPVADRMQTIPMPPDGLTAHIPKVSTGLTEASQTRTNGLNDNVASADITTTTVDANLVTVAGQTDIDRQVLERSLPGLDMVLFDDLLRAYDAELDRQVLDGLTANAEHLGIMNVTGLNSISNSGSTQATFLTDVYSAISKVYSLRYYAPTAIYMHPRRATWLASYQATLFPVFAQGGLFHAVGEQDKGVSGTFAGLPVIIDANIPTTLGSGTNEDWSVVAYEPDFRLAEDDIRQATYEDVLSGKLAVRLQLFAYGFFFPHRYPKSISVIKGYTAPSGF
jgi:HK97 family phage major capsid protein